MPYQVQELGRGQFGSVWLARWHGVTVAVKELHAAANARSSREMIGEAQTLASLRHPCVIAFYGIVIDQVCDTIGSLRPVRVHAKS